MAQENLEVVRRIYADGLIDRDPEWLLELAAADIEYVNPPYAVEAGVRCGKAEVVQAMRSFSEPWKESRHELRELFNCGDAVVVSVCWYTRTRESELELTQEEAHTWTFRTGRIARFEWGLDLAKALEAAGWSD